MSISQEQWGVLLGIMDAPPPRALAADTADRFHAHLDDCYQCRTQPLNLCPIGAAILTGADRDFITKEATGTMEAVRTPGGVIYNGTIVPALVLDLDGTVRYSKNGEFINKAEDVALFPDVEAKLHQYRDNGWLIVGVTNQGGVAFGHKTPDDVGAELEATMNAFDRNPFYILKACPLHEGGTVFPYNRRSLLRKPDIGMLALLEQEAHEDGYLIDWDKSLFVGDREEDRECAARARVPFQWAWEFFGRPQPEG